MMTKRPLLWIGLGIESGQAGRAVPKQSGLTLIELLAVIAIIGVLAGIIIPSVSQFGGESESAQAKQDVGSVSTAVTDQNNDQSGETLSTISISSLVPTVNGSAVSTVTSTLSSLWAEVGITGNATATYTGVFATSGSEPSKVTITDKDGNAISGSDLLTGYNAVDFTTLVNDGYLQEEPASASATSAGGFSQFIWLLKKKSTTGQTDDSRAVALFELTSEVVSGGGGTLPGSEVVTLTYEQIS
jgi:prepilin-type N-terminal cleavage/methylation domain-containing protein